MSRPQLIPSIAAIAMLIGAFGGHPYSYFELLRWVVAIAAAILAFVAFRSESPTLGMISAATVIVFNPIAPFYLGRDVWLMIDAATIVLFIVGSRVAISPGEAPNPAPVS